MLQAYVIRHRDEPKIKVRSRRCAMMEEVSHTGAASDFGKFCDE